MSAVQRAAGSLDRRRSTRPDFDIDIEKSLRQLMVAQRVEGDGFLTIYRGSRSEMLSAGVPASVLDQPCTRSAYEFRANGRDAELTRDRNTYQLTLHWDAHGPRYHSAEHPALQELARMIRIDVGHWLRNDWANFDYRRPLVNTDGLLDDTRAVDYRMPRSRKFRFSPEGYQQISQYLELLCQVIEKAEVTLVEEPPKPRTPRRRKPSAAQVERAAEAARADPQVQLLIAAAIDKAASRRRP